MKKIINFCKPFIFQPFLLKKNDNKNFLFFLSFTDSVIFLINFFKIKKNTNYILLPGYYCPDTVEIFKKYGKVRFYGINNDFTVNKKDYFKQINKYNPGIIINYSFVGFNLGKEEKERLKSLINSSTIIIEDYAHRIIDESPSEYINKNHFYIDSIRKQSSFLGSRLFTENKKLINSFRYKNIFFKIYCYFMQFSRNILETLAFIFKSKRLFNLAEIFFIKIDKKIGSSSEPVSGNKIFNFLFNFIDTKRIKIHKYLVAEYFQKKFSIIQNNYIKTVDFSKHKDWEINHFILEVEPKIQDQLKKYLKFYGIESERLWEIDAEKIDVNQNIFLYESFFIFPLTWLVKKSDVDYIFDVIKNFLKNYEA